MPRRPRSQLPNGMYHVTAQSVWGQSLFLDDEDRRAFLWLLQAVIANFELVCGAYCLMGTHYHLVLSGNHADLSGGMKRLNGRYARRFNERYERTGHVFGGRYSAYVIRDECHLEDTYEYIADNPVKAGLCERPEDWPWTWFASEARDNPFLGEFALPSSLPA